MHINKTSGKSLLAAEILSTYEAKDKYLNGMKVACLINIVKCRIQRHQAKLLNSRFVENDYSCGSYEEIVEFIATSAAI